MSAPKKIGFFHAACMNNFREVIHEILFAAKESGLTFDKLFVFIAGEEKSHEVIHICEEYSLSKKTHYEVSTISEYEYPAIAGLQAYCKLNPNDTVLYFHTKGVSRPDDAFRKYWRRAMIKYVIERWRECEEKLKTFDTVGYNWKGDHYSGGYWWAKAAAINRTKSISDIRKNPVHTPSHFTPQEVDRIQPEFFWRTAINLNPGFIGLCNFDSENRVDLNLPIEHFTRDAFEYAGLKIDKRYIINLNSRVDRLQHAKMELRMAGIKDVERFPAVDGKALGMDGIYGCFHSHLNIIKEAFEKKYNNVLVFEDDLRIERGFQETFPQAFKNVPKVFDCLWIGSYERDSLPGDKVAERIHKPKNIWGTQCYLLSRTGIEKIHNTLTKKNIGVEIDIAISAFIPNLIQYTIFPTLVYQSTSKSDLR
jgi:hypothetical protein